MSACNCMGCPHPVNCRCRCPECNRPAVGVVSFEEFLPASTPSHFLSVGPMTAYFITIPGLPPSVNTTKRHWSVAHKATKQWYETVAGHALQQRIPKPAFPSAIVEIELRYTISKTHGGRRRRDVDNVTKLMLDALVHCGVLADDSYPSLSETRLRARPGPVDEVVLIIREAP